jgi:hypothetical protein
MSKRLFLTPLLFLSACGVKGVPLPPLQPAPIGRGQPIYSTQEPNRQKIKNKYNYKLEQGEDEDPADNDEE